MATHFTEDISLTKMAQDLGYSPFALSRVFSQTFHTNFNRYTTHRFAANRERNYSRWSCIIKIIRCRIQ